MICPRSFRLWLGDWAATGLFRQLEQAALDAIIKDLSGGANLWSNVLQGLATADLQGTQSFHPRAKAGGGIAQLIEEGEQLGSVVQMDEHGAGAEPVIGVVW